MFFDENGIIDIDELIINHPSYQKIMEDGIVTDEELAEQSDKVIALLHDIESKYSEEQIAEIKNLMAEINVLHSVYRIHSIQNA
jgi:methyl coenzyme M reductase alpha subunit